MNDKKKENVRRPKYDAPRAIRLNSMDSGIGADCYNPGSTGSTTNCYYPGNFALGVCLSTGGTVLG
jgi:hypothetical protein